MVPIPSEADEEARRAYREREDLTGERRSIVNKIDGILATLGVKGYKALRRDRREQLNLETAVGRSDVQVICGFSRLGCISLGRGGAAGGGGGH